MLQLHIKATPL